ncbi:Mannan endo-1,6-alpha-mannosidase, partial [Lachnellula willkommii]
MIDYWYYTGDVTYNAEVTQALLWQVGPNQDYMTPNQTKTTGNDDQAFWGVAVMSAAEQKFPDPPAKQPQWLALAQGVFNTQAARWDTTTCGGGLRWQVFTFNTGYNYKNAISNGLFFNLAARLARYTGNDTYAQWAVKSWDWMEAVNLIDENYYVYDGSDDTQNCSKVNKLQWTYNSGALLLGAANMYSYTNESSMWQERVSGLLNGTDVFFPENNTMVEVACETVGKCDVDQHSFKAYLARWMAATTKLAPWTYDAVMAKLGPSAAAAAQQCSGGDNKRTCGLKWEMGDDWDGSYGVGQQMAALEVVQSNLIQQAPGPVTNTTGGTSKGDSAAGTSVPRRYSRAIIFSASSLPSNHSLWPPIFLSVLGSPDPHGRQLDGLGGGISSLSKICIVGPSPHPAADVDYTFAAIGIRDSEVDFSSNCGNMTSAIGPYAVDNGMVDVGDGERDVTVRIRNTNTGKFIHARFAVVDGEAAAGGGFEIDGAFFYLVFELWGANVGYRGSKTGKLLPTGKVVDVLDGVRATCIDAGNPCVFVQAEDMDIEGTILPDEIDAHLPLLSKLDSIRRKAAVAMGLSKDEASAPGSIPKIAMVSRPKTHALLSGETIEQEKGNRNRAVPITVAMAIAAAANLKGSTVQGKVSSERVDPDGITLGHPSGKIMVGAKFDEKGHLLQADVFRTARRLMD